MKNLFALTVAVAIAAGCTTIRNARQARQALAPKGAFNSVSAGERISLKGESLEKLVAFALTNRPSVVSARLAVDDARLRMREIESSAPLASATPWNAADVSVSGGHSEQSVPRHLKDAKGKTDGNASASLSLELLVWDFGRNDALVRQQRENVIAAELSLLKEGFSVFEETSLAYFNWLEQGALLEVALTNQQEYAAHLAREEKRFEEGEANKLDVLRARLDYTKSVESTVAASNSVTTSGAKLMSALGIDASRGIAAEVMGEPPKGLGSVRRGFAATNDGLDETYAYARTNSPSVMIARTKLRAASENVDYAIADLYPQVSASVSLHWADPLWYWSWGVSAAQSVFCGFKKTTAVDRAVVAMTSASSDVDAAEQAVSLALELALAVRDNSVKALETAMASVKSAKENLDTVESQFRVGEASRVDLSDAISSYSTALGSVISAFYSGQRAEAALFGIIGDYPAYREETVTGD